MAVNEVLLNRVREALADVPDVVEKKMFGGICFMVDDKMGICVRNNRMMCRLDPSTYTDELEKDGVTAMILNGRTMKGYVYVDAGAIKTEKDLNYWINAVLEFNNIAKSSR